MRACSALAFIALLCGPARAATLERLQVLMGTTARIQVWAGTPHTCEQAIDAGFEEMAEIDRLMSTYRDDSQVSRLNREAASGWVAVDPRLYEILEAAVLYSKITDGAFDPTVFPLLRLWGFREGPPRHPSPEQLRSCLRRVSYRHIRLHPDGARVRFDRPGVEIDLGGIAKGYALDRAVARLKAAGATAGIVDLGGNLSVFGRPPESLVGVQHPLFPDRLFGLIPLQDASIATSGGYERYILIDGRRYGHILDPRTGRPAETMLSATAIAPTGTAADALSTALFVLGPRSAARILETRPDTGGILIWQNQDGSLEHDLSPGLENRFRPADPPAAPPRP